MPWGERRIISSGGSRPFQEVVYKFGYGRDAGDKKVIAGAGSPMPA